MTTEIKTPTEREKADWKRKLKAINTCGKCDEDGECCGVCEACRRFYLDKCCDEFNLDWA